MSAMGWELKHNNSDVPSKLDAKQYLAHLKIPVDMFKSREPIS